MAVAVDTGKDPPRLSFRQASRNYVYPNIRAVHWANADRRGGASGGMGCHFADRLQATRVIPIGA